MATFAADLVLNLGSWSSSRSGIAFLLAADPSPPIGSEGQWLEIANASTNVTAEAKSFVVEIDTSKNFPKDDDDKHVGLDFNIIYSVLRKPLSEFGVNLSDISDVFVVIYDGKNISIYASSLSRLEDQMKSRVIFHPLNLSFLPDDVYVGFSGSKFDYDAQKNWGVKSWQFSGTDIVRDKRRDQHRQVWIITIATVIVLLCGGGLLFLWIIRKHKLNDLEETYAGIEDQIQDSSIGPQVQKFGFTELKKATSKFNPTNRLGKRWFQNSLQRKFVESKESQRTHISGLHPGATIRKIFYSYTSTSLMEAWTS